MPRLRKLSQSPTIQYRQQALSLTHRQRRFGNTVHFGTVKHRQQLSTSPDRYCRVDRKNRGDERGLIVVATSVYDGK